MKNAVHVNFCIPTRDRSAVLPPGQRTLALSSTNAHLMFTGLVGESGLARSAQISHVLKPRRPFLAPRYILRVIDRG